MSAESFEQIVERLAAPCIAADWEPHRYYRDMDLVKFARAVADWQAHEDWIACKIVRDGYDREDDWCEFQGADACCDALKAAHLAVKEAEKL